MKKEILEAGNFNPGIEWYETGFLFVKAELDKDFIWSMLLKFNDLPTAVNMKYTITFALNPEPTREAIKGVIARLNQKQLEIGTDYKEMEEIAIQNIVELKEKYDAVSLDLWVHSFDFWVLEFKNKFLWKEIKFLTSLATIQDIQKLANKMALQEMVAFLQPRSIDEEIKL